LGGGWDKIKGLGIDSLSKGLRRFNLGSLTEIDLPNEKGGLVPDRAWKKEAKGEPWYLGATYHLAIGQGDIGVTPIQLLTAISAIANGGTLYAPRLADTGEGKILRKDFIDQYNLKIVRDGMEMAVEIGSARRLQGVRDKEGNLVSLAAKTGTAQTGKSSPAGEVTHAWLVAFAPTENPEIAVAVLIEEGGQGHEAALPVAKEMLEEYFQGEGR
jgi:penicillin-binding protein 2